MKRMFNGKILIGETKTLDHVGHLPALISIHSGDGEKVKYAGGMKAIIEFASSTLAKNFLNNKNTSIRIVRLPIRLWCEDNFSAIVRKFGKIIVPFNHIEDRLDLSVVKLGILTGMKKKINEVVRVEVEGKTCDIGVVEYEDEPWFPFKFENEEQPYESQSNYATSEADVVDSKEDEEGISDTWVDEPEDGEIISSGEDDGVGDGGCSGNHVAFETSPAQRSESILEPSQVHAYHDNGVVESNHGENNELNVKDAPIENSGGTIIVTGRVVNSSSMNHVPNLDHSNMGSPKPSSFTTSLAKSDCFGPFPSKVITPLSPNNLLRIR
ncbi:unnamed protein product [Lactuca saligna]|uniref:DUF4283 domain-containing protein n=1 Tax=Lactuca saligna TaxID=75948 RepID=A0AA35VHR7_LACSI|nr:unnamed protein product [Lactuca saligna]